MFEQLADCRFKVLETVVDHRGALLTWDMTFRMRRYRPDRVQTIHGATHLKFDRRADRLSPGLLGRGGGALREAAA